MENTARALSDSVRLAALTQTGLLDSPPEPSFDRHTRLAQRLLGAPMSLVSLVDDHRQFVKSQWGLPEPWASRREMPLSHSFCQHVVATGTGFVVEDAEAHDLVRDNGAVRDLGVRAYLGLPVRSPEGEVLGALCAIDTEPRTWTVDDETSLSDLVASVEGDIALRGLVDLQERAEEALRQKDAFLADMSRELHTPLMGIIGFTEMLIEEVPGEVQMPIGAIHRSAKRLVDTLNAVRDLAQIESGDIALRSEAVDVTAEAREVAFVLQPVAARKRLSLSVEGPRAHAKANRAALRRVLKNLVGNALKFTKEGEVSISVMRTSGAVQFRVADTGIGISETFIPRLYSGFSRASSAPSWEHEGSGLGLAVSKRLVNLMGGAIGVESQVGVGTTFIVTLPAAPADALATAFGGASALTVAASGVRADG